MHPCITLVPVKMYVAKVALPRGLIGAPHPRNRAFWKLCEDVTSLSEDRGERKEHLSANGSAHGLASMAITAVFAGDSDWERKSMQAEIAGAHADGESGDSLVVLTRRGEAALP